MRFRVLGPLEVEGETGPVAVPGRRPRALLTALLLQPGAVVATDRLVDLVWGDRPPEAPANALQQVVARLRSRLADGGPDLADVLVTAPGGYRLAVSPEVVDAEAFERGYRQARRHVDDDPGRAADLLDEVLPLWRGPAYGEHADGFAKAPSTRLDELRTTAREDRAELHLRLGHTAEAVAAARDLVAEHPLRDRPVDVLMRALHAAGRVPDALEAYRSHRDRLADELGLDPPAALGELEASILRGDLAAVPRLRAAESRGSLDDAERPGPAPGSLDRPLPWRPLGLVGRDRDLELLEGCLADQRLVTLVGTGGVGKTRLALEAAHRAAKAGRRVWWADLTAIDQDRVLDALAEATGVEMPRGDDPAAHLAASLHRSSGLLCLDNAESVLDALAPVVELLSATAPRLSVLATSRERLAVAAEHVHHLGPLSLPTTKDPGPAVELFVARAPALEAGALTDADVADIAELCRRLDGLPLAIELGAARAPSFGIREFTEQVADELDLLGGGRRTAASRHQTLRAVVDASYRLLTAEEALLLERLGVFPGRFDLQAVRAVCADDRLPRTSCASLLARLVEQSLVQAGGGRFWLLDTLRTYANELLSGDDRRWLHQRHARHVVTRLGELDWTGRPEAESASVAEITRMTADLHQGWSYAVGHDRPLAVELAARIYDFAYPRQRRDLLDWGRQAADWGVEHPLLPLAWATAVSAAWGGGEFDEAERIGARAGAVEDGSPVYARVIGQWGNLAMFAGRTEQAIARFRRSAELHRAGGLEIPALMTDVCVCQALAYGGDADEARRLLPDLRDRAVRSGSTSAAAWAHYVTGEAIGDTDVAAALAAYDAAVDAARRIDHRLFLYLARSSAVALTARSGSPADALGQLDQLMTDWDEIGNVAAQVWMIRHAALLLERLGHDGDAAELFGAAAANSGRSFFLMGEQQRVADAHRRIGERQGEDFLPGALAAGGRLTLDQALSAARAALANARDGAVEEGSRLRG